MWCCCVCCNGFADLRGCFLAAGFYCMLGHCWSALRAALVLGLLGLLGMCCRCAGWLLLLCSLLAGALPLVSLLDGALAGLCCCFGVSRVLLHGCCFACFAGFFWAAACSFVACPTPGIPLFRLWWVTVFQCFLIQCILFAYILIMSS